VQAVLRRPLSSDLEHNKPVKASVWPWLVPFINVKVFKTIQFVPSPLDRGPPDAAYPKYSRCNGPRRARPGPGPRRDDGFAERTGGESLRTARVLLANMDTHRLRVKQ